MLKASTQTPVALVTYAKSLGEMVASPGALGKPAVSLKILKVPAPKARTLEVQVANPKALKKPSPNTKTPDVPMGSLEALRQLAANSRTLEVLVASLGASRKSVASPGASRKSVASPRASLLRALVVRHCSRGWTLRKLAPNLQTTKVPVVNPLASVGWHCSRGGTLR